MRNQWIARVAAVLVLLGMVGTAAAEERPSPRPLSAAVLQQAIREHAAATRQGRPIKSGTPPARKDSVWNGAAIGAAVGATGGSLAIVAASGGSDDVPAAMMKVSPLGAAVGALVGIAVDALF
jgi:hypothetical protein